MGSDNKVTVFRRQHSGKLDIQRRARKAVGWEWELYADLSEQEPTRRQRLESRFMKLVDQRASDALVEMLRTRAPPKRSEEANSWARFMMSLLHRHPSRITLLRTAVALGLEAQLKDSYSQLRTTDDPQSVEEYVEKAGQQLVEGTLASLVQRLVDSEKIGEAILKMHWAISTARDYERSFMTSDRPLLTSNGLAGARSFLLMPLSPITYLVTANSREIIDAFVSRPSREIIGDINHAVCLQAEHFVLAQNEDQWRFVDNRLGGSNRHQLNRTVREDAFWEVPNC